MGRRKRKYYVTENCTETEEMDRTVGEAVTEGYAEKEGKEKMSETEMVQRRKRCTEGRGCLRQKWRREGRDGQKGEDV